MSDLTDRARALLDAYPEDVFPPLTDTVRNCTLSNGEHCSVDRVAAHAIRVVALPVIAEMADRIEELEADLAVYRVLAPTVRFWQEEEGS